MINKDSNILPLILRRGVACNEGLNYFLSQPSFKDAWNNCPRGDWMLWLAAKINIDERTLYLARGYCANTVIHLMKDERSKNAVKMTIKYGRNKATKKELKAAYAAAICATATAAADDAATDAAYAADAADAAAVCAAATAAATAAAYAAATAAAAYAAKTKNQKKTADMCRKYLTKAIFEKLKI